METEKSHSLLLASWRPQKIWFQKKAHGGNSSPRAGEDKMRCLSSSSEAENRAKAFFCLCFYSRPQWIPYWGGRSTLPNLPVQTLIPPTTPLTHTHPGTMFDVGSPWPVKLTHTINHHRKRLRYLAGSSIRAMASLSLWLTCMFCFLP